MLSKSKRKAFKVSVRTQSNGWSAHGKSRAGLRANHLYSELGSDSWAQQSPCPWCQSPMANHAPKTQNGEVQKPHREYALCCFEYWDGSLQHLITFPRVHFFSWSRVTMLWTLLISRLLAHHLGYQVHYHDHLVFVVWDIFWEGGDVRIYPSEARGKHCSWRQGIQGDLLENWDFFFCATVEQDRPGRLAEWGTWQCPHVSPRYQGYRWSCLVMKTSSRLNVREASHSRFTWEKRWNRMVAVFPHGIENVLCSEIIPSKFLCWYSAANVILLRVGVLRDPCNGGGSSHMWDQRLLEGVSRYMFYQCDIRGVSWGKGMLIEKIPHLIRLACGQSCEVVFLISNWCGWIPLRSTQQAGTLSEAEKTSPNRASQHLKLSASRSEGNNF